MPEVCFIRSPSSAALVTSQSYTIAGQRTPPSSCVVKMPRQSVTAKPRTGPVPNWNRIRPERNVVMLESRIACQARS